MKPLTLAEILPVMDGKPPVDMRPGSIRGVCLDSRKVRRGDLFVAIRGDHHDGHDFVAQALSGGASYALVSGIAQFDERPAISEQLILVEDTRVALGRIAAYYRRQLPATVIAVTGSNGKTTTKSMIHHILSSSKRGRCGLRSYNNDIGVPLTLLSAENTDDYLVVEVGTNAPGEIAHLGSLIRPDIAVLTSVAPAHLAGLGSLQGVVHEKLTLFTHLNPRGLAVVNTDDREVRRQFSPPQHVNVVTFGRSPHADLRISEVQQAHRNLSFKINERFQVCLPVLGGHNAANAVAALAVGRRLGMDMEQVIGRLATFQNPEMRLRMHQTGSLMIINDCYNANPGSMQSALEALTSMNVPGRRVAIVGDMLELGEQATHYHQQVGQWIAQSDIDLLIGVGNFSDVVCSSALGVNRRPLEAHASESVDELVKSLPRWLRSQDTILLKGSRAVRLEKLLDALT